VIEKLMLDGLMKGKYHRGEGSESDFIYSYYLLTSSSSLSSSISLVAM